jgi:hypothetical protein
MEKQKLNKTIIALAIIEAFVLIPIVLYVIFFKR